jgi:medium-chain acyl-[acyl-carrier-protein] hydrolase
METLRLPFAVHSFDADAFGHLAPAALAGYLQEAAGRSAEALGVGFARMQREGLTWVLAREQVELDRAVRLGDTLEVETWPSGLDRLAALRDFRLFLRGEEVGRAITTWFALDLSTRRPARLDALIPERLRASAPHALPAGAGPLPLLDQAAIDRRFQVRFADIDANLHVTHSSYLSWAAEAVDEATWRGQRIASFDIQFLSECHLGAYVRSRSAEVGGGRLHSIVREADGKELARARTTLAPRD